LGIEKHTKEGFAVKPKVGLRNLFIFGLLFFLRNFSNAALAENPNWDQKKQIFFALEIVDLRCDEFSKSISKQIIETLDGSNFIFNPSNASACPVIKVDLENFDFKEVSHRFVTNVPDFVFQKGNVRYFYKLVITFKKCEEMRMKFDISMFLFEKNNWRRVKNPGSFFVPSDYELQNFKTAFSQEQICQRILSVVVTSTWK